jgi:CBS domain-containing protein
MKVSELMTRNPVACEPETKLPEVARIMLENNCGAVPIIEKNSAKPIGLITDRDITCRTIAAGKNPLDLAAGSIMTEKVFTIRDQDPVEKCLKLMEEKQVRRIPVVDAAGKFVGIVSQADIARHLSEHETSELLRLISKPSARAV